MDSSDLLPKARVKKVVKKKKKQPAKKPIDEVQEQSIAPDGQPVIHGLREARAAQE